MLSPHRRDVPLPVAGQVTSLELFFDLVFVFTITQLTATVLPGGWAVTGRAALLLLLLWWMYGGYAWLTNAAPPGTPRRRILLVPGMVGLFGTLRGVRGFGERHPGGPAEREVGLAPGRPVDRRAAFRRRSRT